MKLWTSVLAGLLACGLMAQTATYDGIAAYVNNKVVTIDTVMRELYMNFDISKIAPEQRAQRVRELFPVMRDLIIDRLLILKSYEDSGAQLPPGVVNERIQEILARDFGGDRAKLLTVLKERHMTYDAWEKQVQENLIVAAMRQLQVNKKINVSPRKIREWYEDHKAELSEKSTMHVRMISISPTQGRAVAEAALKALKAKQPFAEVAKQYSSDAYAQEGGDWGNVNPDETFAAPIAEAVKQLKVGKFSDILEVGGYFSIIQKVSVTLGETPTLAQAWPLVEARVTQALGKARYEQWLDELRAKYFVKLEQTEI